MDGKTDLWQKRNSSVSTVRNRYEKYIDIKVFDN